MQCVGNARIGLRRHYGPALQRIVVGLVLAHGFSAGSHVIVVIGLPRWHADHKRAVQTAIRVDHLVECFRGISHRRFTLFHDEIVDL